VNGFGIWVIIANIDYRDVLLSYYMDVSEIISASQDAQYRP
jgi:hypothetical protein